ncbi:MAG: bifunctional diaminohydroxyphosphoribosylaminopyrimidine deaminase/5-amino-6-(5-phosphoribosylamino)uracil reductase RibD [Gammaproteobacteria bacterium]|nr:bifunctional diaminohydroxyphosphoribosylaminopyrimidine deaminase/5-amino-6-(5-phosphoribosylamino)uracil reductase RibD [Gammaproteobacteria bacterium]MBQ0841116.1 bifunctional diaminohydroxyphosphoribosylaminopyrimidine deaminase/5-amino-6-(5-phosphoribosylamino)uracil reductase RibD [Gammaproteobacteria bacterium]
MARAIQLAKKGWYTARPNPRVGCVIVRAGAVVGKGWHQRAGGPHAEIAALEQAGDAARGATAYVSLEPCNHHGRTPPCADALITAGIARLVYGLADPHVIASGGIGKLEAAGICVDGPVLEQEARALNAGFVKRCETGLPRVILKLAASMDGRSAMASGESQWITGPAARRDVQRIRAENAAIITGIGTVLEDNPALTVREVQPGLDESMLAEMQPLRVIVDSRLRTTEGLNILQPPGAVLIATAQSEGHVEGVEVCSLPNEDGKVDLQALLAELGRRECNDVLVEAGGKLAGVFLQQGLVDELIIYMAPKLMGSAAMPMAVLPFEAMSEALDLEITDMRAVGKDWRMTAKPGGGRCSQA